MPQEIIYNFASFLDDVEVGNFSIINKRNKQIFSIDNVAFGKRLRERSKFGVADIHGNVFFLKEYLSQQGPLEIARANNIILLAQERPSDFLKLVFKSIPQTLESINNNLNHYVKEVIKIDELVSSVPNFHSSEKIAAALIVHLSLDESIRNNATEVLIDFTLNRIQQIPEFDDRNSLQYLPRFMRIFEDGLALNYLDQIFHDPDSPGILKIKKLSSSEIVNRLVQPFTNQFNNQITTTIRQFDDASIDRDEQCFQMLSHVVDYSFVLSQLLQITIFNSIGFKRLIHESVEFNQLIKSQLPEDEVIDFIGSVEIPDVSENKNLVKSQLNIIKRILSGEKII